MANLTSTTKDKAYAATGSTQEQATEAILQLSAESRSGRGDSTWTRDELHERRDELVSENPFAE